MTDYEKENGFYDKYTYKYKNLYNYLYEIMAIIYPKQTLIKAIREENKYPIIKNINTEPTLLKVFRTYSKNFRKNLDKKPTMHALIELYILLIDESPNNSGNFVYQKFFKTITNPNAKRIDAVRNKFTNLQNTLDIIKSLCEDDSSEGLIMDNAEKTLSDNKVKVGEFISDKCNIFDIKDYPKLDGQNICK